MATFKNNKEITVTERPKTPEAWQDNPQVKFGCSSSLDIGPGDRIELGTQMSTTGKNSGGIETIYYVLQSISMKAPGPAIGEMNITATVKRLAL